MSRHACCDNSFLSELSVVLLSKGVGHPISSEGGGGCSCRTGSPSSPTARGYVWRVFADFGEIMCLSPLKATNDIMRQSESLAALKGKCR